MSLLTELRNQSIINWLAAQGYVFNVSDGAQGDLVTGQTSFADTTPTFQLRVPSGYVGIPLLLSLNQSGTIAGGAIDLYMEIDDADRYASGGTSETILCARTDGRGPFGNTLPTGAAFRSNPTAAAGYGVRVDGSKFGPDISTAEGAVNEYVWTPPLSLDFIIPPAGVAAAVWNVYTWAGTTGPSWLWSAKFALFPDGLMPGISGGTAG